MKNIKLEGDLFLAPMADYTDAVFRKMCREAGASLVFTEMISVNALMRENSATIQMLRTLPDENPVGVQLFGSIPENFVEAIKVIERLEKENKLIKSKFDIIDLNFGCPASKIIKQGAGSALLERPNQIKKIVEAVTKATKKPVSCKIRSGINDKKINCVEIAKICEEAGASMIIIHPRTQKQGYSGKADWSLIKEVKEAVKIPVCGNGDIKSYEDYLKMKKETGCDFVMIGRAAMGNPFIFKEILSKGKININKIDKALEYLNRADEAGINFKNIKGNVLAFTKGIPNSTVLRNNISNRANTINGLRNCFK